MHENALLAHIFSRSAALSSSFPDLLVGPGDDCAVVQTSSGDKLLLKVDQLIELRHFVSSTPIDLIARKAIARAVSDIAAMGGEPLWSLCAAQLPPGYHHANELFDRLSHWALHFSCPLIGGDIASLAQTTPSTNALPALAISITLIGKPATSRGPVLRSTARAGDELWITGKIGGSFSSQRHLSFTPRLAEARWLCQTLGPDLHAMLDISDGLGLDASRLAERSHLRAIIESKLIPLHDGETDPIRAAREGEDYQLLFAVAPGSLDRVLARAGTSLAPFTRIGKLEAGTGCLLLTPDGSTLDASTLGFQH